MYLEEQKERQRFNPKKGTKQHYLPILQIQKIFLLHQTFQIMTGKLNNIFLTIAY